MNISIHNPEGASTRHNPLFRLVVEAEAHGWSEKKALQEALRTKFLTTVKKKHYEEVINFLRHPSSTSTDTYPRLLVRVTLQSARRQKIDRGLWCVLNLSVGGILLGAAEWSAAEDHFLEAKKSMPAFLPVRMKEQFNLALIVTQFLTGNLTGMERLFGNEAKGSERVGAGECVGVKVLNVALLDTARGDFDKAVESLESAKGEYWLAGENTFLRGLVGCLVYSRAGRIEEAIEYLKIPRDFQEPELRIKMLDVYGTMLFGELLGLGEHGSAYQLAETLHELFESEGEIYGSLRWNKNRAESLQGADRSDEALIIYERTLGLFQRNGNDLDAADCMRQISRILGERGDYARALQMLDSAKHVYERKRVNRRIAESDWETGLLLLEQGRYKEAYGLFCSSSPYIRSDKWPFVVDYAFGEALRGMGQLQEARKAYETVADSLTNFMNDLSMTRHRTTYGQLLLIVFIRLIDICLAESDFARALEYVERSKTRGLTEILLSMNNVPAQTTDEARGELKKALVGLRAYGRGFIEDKDFDALQAITKDLPEARLEYQDIGNRLRQSDSSSPSVPDSEISWEEIQALADDRTALIELFPMEDKTIIFVVKHDLDLREGTIVIEDYGISKLFPDIEALRKSRSASEVKKVLDSILKRLYEKIFVRIEPLVSGSEHLIFIPSSEFHLVPWHALCWDEKGLRKYVLDEHLVSYAPNAQILRLCLSRNPARRKRAFVGHANPDKKRKLRYSELEANAIARLLGVEPALSSTKRDIIEHGGSCDIFHYTGHACSESLELHGEQSVEEKELLHLWEIVERLHLPGTDLAVLSACDTGKVRGGFIEEYVGVASGFLMAGAATVVSSLWTVSDHSTSLLMGKMYSLLDSGAGKAQALKDAQIWLRDSARQERLDFLKELGVESPRSIETDSNDSMRYTRKAKGTDSGVGEDLSHPYYWAGFICTGAP